MTENPAARQFPFGFAAADFDVKGGGRDPQYAVEHAVLEICKQRHAPPERG